MKTVKVWDLFVRFFHWSLVAGVIAQLTTAEDLKSVHAAAGYIIIVLLILRIIWGFVGPVHARFTNFIYPPADILAYLRGLIQRRPMHYTGHNPAGGAMVCTLLFFLEFMKPWSVSPCSWSACISAECSCPAMFIGRI
jgi:cytochrome b